MIDIARRYSAIAIILATFASCSNDEAASPGTGVATPPGGPTATPTTPPPAPTTPPTPGATPRRVVFFLGDGMGINVMTAARIFAKGESGSLTMDTLPETGFVRTYSKDSQVTDSAAAMTAYMTGVKVANDVLSMSADTPYKGTGTPVKTLLEIAESDKLATGVVTTTRVTHATPAATYAHTSDRDREDDIAAQVVPGEKTYNAALGDGLEVLFGGGTRQFVPSAGGAPGRADGKDLVAAMKGKGYAYAGDKASFDALPASATKVFGLFGSSHMSYELDRDASKEPSLAEMSVKAVDVLAKNPRGFFLMVEGGRIDHALHATNAKRALEDLGAFDAAIAAALPRVNLSETLVVVTADHDHTMVINGYAKRGNSILDVVRDRNDQVSLDADGLSYPVLAFGNGESRPDVRTELSSADTMDSAFHQLAGVRRPAGGETHGGGDVMLFATGAGSGAFHGTIENTQVFALVKSALGL